MPNLITPAAIFLCCSFASLYFTISNFFLVPTSVYQEACNIVTIIVMNVQDREAQPMKLRVKFGERPMTSAFIEFLQAVKADQDINAKLRQLHFRIGERFVYVMLLAYFIQLYCIVENFGGIKL